MVNAVPVERVGPVEPDEPVQPVDHVGLVHGPAATLALRTAAEQLGGTLVGSRLRSVDHRPGSGAVAVHEVTVAGGDGSHATHTLALTTDVDAMAGGEGTLVLTSGSLRLGVWRLPHDPALPGLVPALDPGAVAALLTACGVRCAPGDVRLRTRAYRPGRRAVVEARAGAGRLFLKVVPPHEARDLHDRHRLLVAAGVPSPHSLGVDPRGVVVLQALAGATWREQMRAGVPSPPARAVWQAMDRLPPALLEQPRRPSWSEQSWHHVALLEAALPSAAARVRAVAAFADVQAAVAATPVVPVHGDLYEAQLMVTGPEHRPGDLPSSPGCPAPGRLSGILDLDTAGPGHRLDDEACLGAHLALLPVPQPDLLTPCVTAWHEHLAGTRSDPVVLWRRTALVLLTLATGPTRTRREGWQATAGSWFRLAELLLEREDDRPWEGGPEALAALVTAARAATGAATAGTGDGSADASPGESG